MDWDAAIEKHREALKRVLAGLLAMAGFVGGAPGTCDASPAFLPRHLHRAVLRLLRPAEAAVRRLVIVAARGIVVEVRQHVPTRLRKAADMSASIIARKPPPISGETSGSPEMGGGMPRAAIRNQEKKPSAMGFPIFDPPSRWGRARRRPAQLCVPRIAFPGITALSPVRLPPLPGDPVDTAPLARRLAALGRALDDLPRQAQRFARWQARVSARSAPAGRAGLASTPIRRIWPLRPGRLPGRLPARDRRPAHAVHDILTDIHGLALWALEPADTS